MGPPGETTFACHWKNMGNRVWLLCTLHYHSKWAMHYAYLSCTTQKAKGVTQNEASMLEFTIDYIYTKLGGHTIHQISASHMGTNYASIFAVLSFIHISQGLYINEQRITEFSGFNITFKYIYIDSPSIARGLRYLSTQES